MDLPKSDKSLAEDEPMGSDDDSMEEPDGHKRLLAMIAGESINPDMPE